MTPAERIELFWVIVCAFGLVLALVFLALRLRRDGHALPRNVVLAVAACALASTAFRLFAVKPAFVHAEFYGPELVTDILAFPDRTPRNPYGMASYGALALLGSAFGRTAEAILAGNVVLAGLATFPLAVVAAIWTRRPLAAAYAAALWAASPLVARLAHAEDAHVAGALFALTAAAALGVAAEIGSRAALAAALFAIELTIASRQTYYAWIPVFLVLGLRARRAHAAAPVLVAIASVLAVALRMLPERATSSFKILALAFALLAKHPSDIAGCLATHPMLELTRLSIVVPPLAIVGAVVIARAGRDRLAFFGGVAGATLVTLPAAWPSPGASWGFRLPQYLFVLVAAAAGAAAVAEALAPRVGRARAIAATAGAIVLAGVLASGTREALAPNAEFEDYRAVRAALAARVGSITLLAMEHQYPRPRYEADVEAARQLGIPIAEPADARAGKFDPGRASCVYVGLGCYAFTVSELMMPAVTNEKDATTRLLAEPTLLRALLFDARGGFGISGLTAPTAMRAACAELASGQVSEPLGVAPLHPIDAPPTAVFSRREIAPALACASGR